MSTARVRPLRARGDRVWVRTVTEEDLPAYERAVRASWERIGQWNPVSIEDLQWHLGRQSTAHRTFLIHAAHPRGEHDIVGKVNVSNVVRGRFQNGTMGYDAYDPYAGTGLFAEGLRLIVGLAFAEEPHGMGLHRVEANVRPGNERSAGLLRSLGFRREGHIRSMLLLESGGQDARWRDHDAFGVTRDEWPAAPHQPHRPPRIAALVNGVPVSGKTTLASALAAELGVPLFSRDTLAETVFDHLPEQLQREAGGTGRDGAGPLDASAEHLLWTLLAASPVGAVLDGSWRPGSEQSVVAGLARAGFDPGNVPQVWCSVPPALARRRSGRRRLAGRHPVHAERGGGDQGQPAAIPVPPSVGQVLRADTSEPLRPGDVTGLALQVRAHFS